MSKIVHHVPERLLIAYASGSLGHAFSLLVASHVSMCDDCRATFEAHCAVGGALLQAGEGMPVAAQIKSDLMARLDEPASDAGPVPARSGPYPAPVMTALRRATPRWRPLGFGVRQDILVNGAGGSVRLLSIPAGHQVPDHGHGGLEMTLVLQGSFSDHTGRFGVGDIEVANQDLEHTPVADADGTCICLAATDAPLQFRSMVPRMLQPMFRI